MTCHPGTRVACEHCGDWGCAAHEGHVGEHCECWPCDECGELIPPDELDEWSLCPGCQPHTAAVLEGSEQWSTADEGDGSLALCATCNRPLEYDPRNLWTHR